MTGTTKRNTTRARLTAWTLCVVTGILIFPAIASADVTFGSAGSGTGQWENAQGIAVDDATGDVVVADTGNNRIDVFSETGEFLRTFGWGVEDGTAEPQTCQANCLDGLAGSGSGQFNSPASLAVDNIPTSPSFGDIFVYDSGNHRVERFDGSGAFILTFGAGVDKTTKGNVCTAISGDACGSGGEGFGPGQFNEGVRLADTENGVMILDDQSLPGTGTDEKRVRLFDPSGTMISEPLSLGPEPGGINGFGASASGTIYIALPAALGIRRYSNSGALLGTFDKSFNIQGLAVDANGHILVSDVTGAFGHVDDYNENEELVAVAYGDAARRYLNGAASLGGGNDLVFRANATVSGEIGSEGIFGFDLPPAGPVVPGGAEAVSPTSIGNTTATLSAPVDPEGAATTYHFEYLTQAEFETGGFANPAVKSTTETTAGTELFGARSATAKISDLAPETEYRFRLVASNANGSVISATGAFETREPLQLVSTFATAVTAETASVHAEINPLGIPGSAFFEYVDDATYQATGFAEAQEAPDVAGGASPLALSANSQPEVLSAVVDGLTPNTIYHYRVIAEDSFVSLAGPERSFRTSPVLGEAVTNCPNQVFRTGLSARLPDCRAYEMVSPVDKSGGSVGAKPEDGQLGTKPEGNHYVMMDESSADGSRATYTSFRSFAEAQSAPLFNQFLSTRGSEGWSTKGISPPRNSSMRGGGVSFFNRFQSFSEDLCSTTFFDDSSFPLVPEAPAGYSNLYRIGLCSSEPTYELLSDAIPFGIKPEAELEGNILTAQGASADLSHTLFTTLAGGSGNGSLTSDSCKTGNPKQLYESSPGGLLRLVSVLPNGKAACQYTAVGAGGTNGFENFAPVSANAHNAVSPDGSRVFWSANPSSSFFADLYLRINSTQPQSKVAAGKCTESELACTIVVSEGPEAVFWDANPETTKALYTVGQLSSGAELREYDLEEGKSHEVAQGVTGLVGDSEDLSRIYFTSRQALSAEANGEGDKALQGQPNLYLEEGGSITFVATIGGGGGANSPDSLNPGIRTSRVAANGLEVAFTAATQPTHYDNTDARSGEPDTEVFLYTADPGAAGRLVCVSCNPDGDRPSGELTSSENGATSWAASELPPWGEIRRPTRLLSADGNRLFFESYSDLVPNDTNGRRDIYEWERADSSRACEEAGAGLFSASNGGCLSLISSGQSADESELIDASADGSNVFFSTSSSLLPQDPGLVDVYDARIDGGFPQPIKTAACEGEACQGPVAPPNDPTPGSATLNGAGNVKEAKAKKAHKKKHAKKHSKKKQNAKQRANDKRRAGR